MHTVMIIYSWNFFPYALLNQFRSYFNIFFLASVGLYSIEIISPVNGLYESIPFIVVLAIAIFREGYEDYNKLKYDNVYNNSLSLSYIYSTGEFESFKWKDISIGQVIKVKRNEVIPADLIILKSSNTNGFCFMQTMDLDGETNLKPREAIAVCQNMLHEDASIASAIKGSVEEELPNKNVYEAEGCLMLDSHEKIYYNISNCLLRSGILKNAEYIIGLVIYTGNDTKIMQNIKKEPQKLSKIDLLLNKTLIILFLMQIVMTCILTTIAIMFDKKNSPKQNELNMDYVFYKRQGEPESNFGLEFFKILTSFLYIFSLLIPISIMVTLELVKTFQTVFLNEDSAYRQAPNEKTKYLSLKLHENLGDVKYILTDKTGTLTKNEMEFKVCSIFSQVFTEIKDSNKPLKCQLSKNKEQLRTLIEKGFNSLQSNQFLSSNKSNESNYSIEQMAIEFFIDIAINHNALVSTEEEKDRKNTYSGSNPDEIVLVQYAKEIGIEFIERTGTSCTLKILDKISEYTILNRFDFTSERKRSSIIVKDPSGVIKLYIKGSDNVIMNKLNSFSNNNLIPTTKEQINEFSKEGLRILCFAMKSLTDEQYNDWLERYKEMQSKVLRDNSLVKEIEQQISELENDLLLLGVSGLEDLLQEEVSSCILDFISAEINVWMLTGDKLDTARSIGYSCKLLNEEYKVYKIYEQDAMKMNEYLRNIISDLNVCAYKSKIQMNQQQNRVSNHDIEFQNFEPLLIEIKDEGESEKEKESDYSILDRIKGKSQKDIEDNKISSRNISLIIEGESITQCLNEENKKIFYECVSQCRSVICSRCSPGQKAEIVKFIKRNSNHLTLAIGDGGNDVNMLQSADIGIGIFGKEGSQAAYSSDFAFSQFKYLRRLLFVHGRFSIQRNSYFVYYSFFKNIIALFAQFWNCFFNGYSGSIFFDNIFILGYNSFLAILLPCTYSIFEEDIDSSFRDYPDKAKNQLLLPRLYKEMRDSEPLSVSKFAMIIISSVLFSIPSYFIPMLSYGSNILTGVGRVSTPYHIFILIVIVIRRTISSDLLCGIVIHLLTHIH